MRRSGLLVIDGIGNVVLGGLLLCFPVRLAIWLGIHNAGSGFYASLFGAVLVGIGLALLIEVVPRSQQTRGLGLFGALTINLCFGVVLGGWLVFGHLQLPARGLVVLWALVAILVGLSSLELACERRTRARPT